MTGVQFSAGAGDFSLLHHILQTGSGAYPASYPMGTLSLAVKCLGYEADHSPPPSAEIKNAWHYTSTPQYIFMAWCLVKHRDNFYLYLFYILPKLSVHILYKCIKEFRS
jgi:hypothetical protein